MCSSRTLFPNQILDRTIISKRAAVFEVDTQKPANLTHLSPNLCSGTQGTKAPLRDSSACECAKLLQLCLTLCDSMDGSAPGSSVHVTLQARILEWIAMPSSRGSSWPRDWTHLSYVYLHWQVGSLPLEPPGKPEGLKGSKRSEEHTSELQSQL